MKLQSQRLPSLHREHIHYGHKRKFHWCSDQCKPWQALHQLVLQLPDQMWNMLIRTALQSRAEHGLVQSDFWIKPQNGTIYIWFLKSKSVFRFQFQIAGRLNLQDSNINICVLTATGPAKWTKHCRCILIYKMYIKYTMCTTQECNCRSIDQSRMLEISIGLVWRDYNSQITTLFISNVRDYNPINLYFNHCFS